MHQLQTPANPYGPHRNHGGLRGGLLAYSTVQDLIMGKDSVFTDYTSLQEFAIIKPNIKVSNNIELILCRACFPEFENHILNKNPEKNPYVWNNCKQLDHIFAVCKNPNNIPPTTSQGEDNVNIEEPAVATHSTQRGRYIIPLTWGTHNWP